MISSAFLVQVNGWARSFEPSMPTPMAVSRSLTLWNSPRRIACLVAISKKMSITEIMFMHAAWIVDHA
jgi:hypothetical protein